MSLVIARTESVSLYILADTQITPVDYSIEKPFDALKILFLNKMTAIAYSGKVPLAHRIIHAVYEKCCLTNDINTISKEVEILCKQKDSPDFLLMGLAPDFCVKKVSSNKIFDINLQITAWVGDSAAAKFVAEKSAGGTINELCQAFSLAIENPKFTTVGGYRVLAQGTKEGFKFVPYMELTSARYRPEAGWATVDFGTAQTGGFGFTTITPKSVGQNGFGLYYFQGRFGYFFHVDLQKNKAERLKVSANSVKEFVEILEEEIHIPLEYCGDLS
jgi:hypothetical protein